MIDYTITWHPGADVTVTTGEVITRDIKCTHHDPVLLCRSNKRDECISHVCETTWLSLPSTHCGQNHRCLQFCLFWVSIRTALHDPQAVSSSYVPMLLSHSYVSADSAKPKCELFLRMFPCGRRRACPFAGSLLVEACFWWAPLALFSDTDPRLKPTFQLPIKAGMFLLHCS